MTAIAIDLDSKTPPFEQIKTSIIDLVASGSLPIGHQLPPIRQLAGDLGVAPNTVARAYRELELANLLKSRGRRGTVVAATPDPAIRAVDVAAIQVAVLEARQNGMSTADIVDLVTGFLER